MNAESATQNIGLLDGVEASELARCGEAAKLQLQLDIAFERARLGFSDRSEARARFFVRARPLRAE